MAQFITRNAVNGRHAQPMRISTTEIVDTFAEAFSMHYCRLEITAADDHWLTAGLNEFCGFSSSVIGCDLEIGVERKLAANETLDGRVGATVLAFGFSAKALAKAIPNRVGQCLMTCPSTAVYDGITAAGKRLPLGKHVRFFGDGYQKSKVVGSRRYWRIPVMDGEFLVEDTIGVEKGIGGGNLIIQGQTAATTMEAARRGVDAISLMEGTITPFPGGVARSGSKVGSRYKALKASTADAFCPSLRGRVPTKLCDGANSALEIVIDGTSEPRVADAMAAAIRAAVGEGVVGISAGNYGGELGPHHFHLRKLMR